MLEKYTSESGDRVHKDVEVIGLPDVNTADHSIPEGSDNKSKALSEISEEAGGTGNSTPSMLRFDPDELEAEISAIKKTGLVESEDKPAANPKEEK